MLPTFSDALQSIRLEKPELSYKQTKEQLVQEFAGKPFPSLHNLTIPEQDARARKKTGRPGYQ